jgi:putative Mn2+ efflux pump MntP
VTTFLCTCVALLIGRRFGEMLGERATIIGGIVLIAIGLKAMFF